MRLMTEVISCKRRSIGNALYQGEIRSDADAILKYGDRNLADLSFGAVFLLPRAIHASAPCPMDSLPIVTAHAILSGLRALGYDADACADAAGRLRVNCSQWGD